MSTQIVPTPTLDNATEIAIFLHDLESLDECRCENLHRSPDNATCSHSVTHRFTCGCGHAKNICRNASEYVRYHMENHPYDESAHGDSMNACGYRVMDWRIVAI